ncbi:hypothetical protein FACS1894208_11780 [Clostridia bacterium]|nr:hypothetical protein FACS1894208_11780 [Clostridia bacterium]
MKNKKSAMMAAAIITIAFTVDWWRMLLTHNRLTIHANPTMASF